MEITKLRLTKMKNGNGLELGYDKPGPAGDKITVPVETHSAIVHGDLYNAIQALAPHLAIMAFHVKEVEDIAMPDPEIFSAFSVGSYTISGKDEKRGLIISGTLRKHGKAHNFNTPFYRFEEPESSRYQYMDDVVAKLRNIETETPLYLDGTKRGEPAQKEIPYEGPGKADGEAMKRVAEMDNEPKKPKGKKRVAQSADVPSGVAE